MLTNADIQPVLKHASTVRSNSTCSRDDKYSSVTLQNNSHHYYVVLRLQSRWHVMQRHVQCKCERWPLTTETCWMRHTVRQPTSKIAQSVSCSITLDKKYVPRNAMGAHSTMSSMVGSCTPIILGHRSMHHQRSNSHVYQLKTTIIQAYLPVTHKWSKLHNAVH